MKIEELVAIILGVVPTVLTDQSGPATLKSWNSMAHMRMVMTIEEVYGVSFSTAEIRAITSISDVRALLNQKGVTV